MTTMDVRKGLRHCDIRVCRERVDNDGGRESVETL